VRRFTTSGALLGLVVLSFVALLASPASAADTNTGIERPLPDDQGDSAYCKVSIGDLVNLGGGNWGSTGTSWFDGIDSWIVPSGSHQVTAACQVDPAATVTQIKVTLNGTERNLLNDMGYPLPDGQVRWYGTMSLSGAVEATTCVVVYSGAGPGGNCSLVPAELRDHPEWVPMPGDHFVGGEAGDFDMFCDVTGVIGDTGSAPKDPAQTYRYEVSFAGRNGLTPAPDVITFSASWQENNEDAELPYTDVTAVAPATKTTSSIAVAEFFTPPAESPLVIEVHFPEPKSYALSFGCQSDDGHLSYWTGGDYLPDPESEHLLDDIETQRLQECVPSGWGVLNPIAMGRVLGCVLKYLFAPHFENSTAPLRDALDGSVLDAAGGIQGTLTGSWGAMADAAGANDGGCQGPAFTLPIDALDNPEVALLSTCTAPASTFAPIVRGFVLFGLGFMVLFAALRGLGRVIGHDGGV
jgi:hypothetical protein